MDGPVRLPADVWIGDSLGEMALYYGNGRRRPARRQLRAAGRAEPDRGGGLRLSGRDGAAHLQLRRGGAVGAGRRRGDARRGHGRGHCEPRWPWPRRRAARRLSRRPALSQRRTAVPRTRPPTRCWRCWRAVPQIPELSRAWTSPAKSRAGGLHRATRRSASGRRLNLRYPVLHPRRRTHCAGLSPLRSNNCDEHEDEARQGAPVARRAIAGALPKRATAHPPAPCSQDVGGPRRNAGTLVSRQAVPGGGPLGGAAGRLGLRPGAPWRASWSDSPRLFERSSPQRAK